MSSIPLDGARYSRAKAILTREFPSRQQLVRFKWTKNLTLGAFAFAFLWIWAAASGSTTQRSLLIVAMACYTASVGLFLSNLPILRRLWRTWVIARRLGYSRPRVTRSRAPVLERLKNLTLLALLMPGIVITVVSGVGLVAEIETGRWLAAGFAVISVVFGLMCLLMYPMARVREQLHAIAALQASLETAAVGAGDTVEIPTFVYDDLSEFERLQIETDRAEVMAARRRHFHESGTSGLHIRANFFEALAALDTAQADLVRRVLDELSTGSRQVSSPDAGARAVEVVAVPATTLSIEIQRQGSGRRIDVLALRLGDALEDSRV